MVVGIDFRKFVHIAHVGDLPLVPSDSGEGDQKRRGFFSEPHVVVGLGCLVRLSVHQSFAWLEDGLEEADRVRKTARS